MPVDAETVQVPEVLEVVDVVTCYTTSCYTIGPDAISYPVASIGLYRSIEWAQ